MVCLITVLSIGERDYRVRRNLCLTARAFGAEKIIFVGKRDSSLATYMARICTKWGGSFKVEFAASAQSVIRPLTKYKKVYFTMYGAPLRQAEYTIRTYKNLLLILTTKEYDGSLAKLADFTVSITTQPHAQVTSVAVFLHEFFSGREPAIQFPNAKYKIIAGSDGIHVKKA